MATGVGIRISGLPVIDQVTGDTVIPGVVSGATKGIKLDSLAQYLISKAGITGGGTSGGDTGGSGSGESPTPGVGGDYVTWDEAKAYFVSQNDLKDIADKLEQI